MVSNLVNKRLGPAAQRRQLELIQSLNERHLRRATSDRQIEGLIASYELAFRMQSTMPRIMNLEDESKATRDLYGIGSEPTDNFGRQCLLARRFAELGVIPGSAGGGRRYTRLRYRAAADLSAGFVLPSRSRPGHPA